MRVPLTHRELSASNQLGELLRQDLHKANVFTVSIIGGPGCGKTCLIDHTIDCLPDLHIGVIAGDMRSARDAEKIRSHTRQVTAALTGEQPYLNAGHIRDALMHIALDEIDFLFVENVGSLNDPADRDLGEDAIAAVFSVAAGDDKAQKHQDLVRAADVVLLNKIDLMEAVPFSSDVFRRDVQRLNPAAELIELSALTGVGLNPWLRWLRHRVRTEVPDASVWFGCL
jgi:hydrogenase nickel incorporation protein HypB